MTGLDAAAGNSRGVASLAGQLVFDFGVGQVPGLVPDEEGDHLLETFPAGGEGIVVGTRGRHGSSWTSRILPYSVPAVG
jgi:hypothetical protein